MSDTTTGKWCWSLDEEQYQGRFDTKEDAEGDALDSVDEHECVWVAQCCHPVDSAKLDAFRVGDDLLEELTERCGEEIGGEDACMDLSKEHKESLGKLVIDFLRENAKVNYYGIKNLECIEVEQDEVSK